MTKMAKIRYPIYDQNGWKNHTLRGRTYLYSPYKGLPPRVFLRLVARSTITCQTSVLIARAKRTQVTLKGGEIRDTKTLNLSPNIVSLKVLGRCFAFVALRDQLVAQQKHLLRVEEMQHGDWLICMGINKFVASQVVSSKPKMSDKAKICPSK